MDEYKSIDQFDHYKFHDLNMNLDMELFDNILDNLHIRLYIYYILHSQILHYNYIFQLKYYNFHGLNNLMDNLIPFFIFYFLFFI